MISQEKTSQTVEEIKQAEAKVLVPELDTKEFELLGKKILLRPLPLFFSKQINVKLTALQDKFSDAVRAKDDASAKQSVKTLDIDVVDGLIDATLILSRFYKLGLTREVIEGNEDNPEGATTHQLVELCIQQVKKNGDNDFLLQPLRTITTLAIAAGLTMNRMRSSLSTVPSASSGESTS